MMHEETIDTYLAALASSAPTPGGGSAATLVGACGAALVAMVARITSNNPKYAEHFTLASNLVHRGDGLRNLLLQQREADETAYEAVVEASALPRATDEEKAFRAARMQAALRGAAEAPLRTATYAADIVGAACHALELGNAHLVSDLGCAAEFGAASLAAAAYSVRINHKFLKDQSIVAAQAAELGELEARTARTLERVREALNDERGQPVHAPPDRLSRP